MWAVKPHYYGSHFYNWPYTYGLLFGLGPVRPVPATTPSGSGAATTTLLSRAGMDTAEELGAAFGIDVTDEAFWTASLDVIRDRIAEYEQLADEPGGAELRRRRCTDAALRRRRRDELGRLLDGRAALPGRPGVARPVRAAGEPDELTTLPEGAARPARRSSCRRR